MKPEGGGHVPQDQSLHLMMGAEEQEVCRQSWQPAALPVSVLSDLGIWTPATGMGAGRGYCQHGQEFQYTKMHILPTN